jgi:predicted O-methyltransferase YrrM
MAGFSTLSAAWAAIDARSRAGGFAMPSDVLTGALLRALAASKPGGRLLELGTGTGLATACLLDGMDAGASLVSVDIDPDVQAVAREVLGGDPRLHLRCADGAIFLRGDPGPFDLIFADAMAGKYEDPDLALALLAPGGVYVVDDLLEQPNWPPDHQPRVDALRARLEGERGLAVAWLPVGTGHMLAVRTA